MPHLTPRYRVIAFDNRGVGQSDVPPGPYPMPLMASDAVAVLDAAGVARARVLGASMGGFIAQELAISHPQRVSSLILCCTAVLGPSNVGAERKVREALASRAGMKPEDGVRATAPYTYDPGTPRDRVDQDLEVRMRNYASAEGYLAQLAGIAASETESRVGGIACPTLVIHGDSDQLIPTANGRILAERIPGAELRIIPGASHILWTDQEGAVASAVLDFLERADRKAVLSQS